MKNIAKFLQSFILIVLLTMAVLFNGCQKYLDKSPDAGIAESEMFKNFKNFQGYAEGINMMMQSTWTSNSIGALADEGYMVTPNILSRFDAGDYMSWMSQESRNIFGRGLNPVNLSPAAAGDNRGVWPCSWYAINAANRGLANLDKMYGSDQEKAVIKGELLFFRAFFHFNIMQYWGGMPYIDKYLSAADGVEYLPRISFQAATKFIEKDLTEAYNLLPVDWNQESYGQYTINNNKIRLTKFSALAVLGKSQLFAGSPLMNYEANGKKEFDPAFCKQAATTFRKLISLCDSTGKKSLQPWAKNKDTFFTMASQLMPDATEALLIPDYPVNPSTQIRGVMYCLFAPKGDMTIYGCQYFLNLNYAFSKNFGMANGLPITEPDAGYSDNDPWSNRDSRFNAWICKDNDKVTKSAQTNPLDQYAQFYTGGRHRGTAATEVYTGIGTKKFWDETCNAKDTPTMFSTGNYVFNPPIIRLADVYLMYAESILWGYGTPTSVIPGDTKPLNSVQAVNKVRNRAGVPDVDARFTGDRDKFFELLVKERAVEFLLEGQRFNDLRRWLRNTDSRYLNKTAIDFDRDPITKKPKNLKEYVIATRMVTDRNNWLPIPPNVAAMYPGFYQNPGW